MMTETGSGVDIRIDEEELVKSIALLKNLRDFCKEENEEGAAETASALQVAIEAMIAFYSEHFGEGDDDIVNSQE